MSLIACVKFKVSLSSSAAAAAPAGARTPSCSLHLQPTFVLTDHKAAQRLRRRVLDDASASFSWESESSDSPGSEAPPFYDLFGVHSGGR
uniref:Uncharacterized protein n=1 Tax=Oryza punctata TaxID=4537 RepID=A0A0E0JQU9_ORYPU